MGDPGSDRSSDDALLAFEESLLHPPLDTVRSLVESWIRTREAYGPVWWPKFREAYGTDLDRAQFNLLRLIAHSPARSLTELAYAAMMTTSTASRLVESLVRTGLVERVRPVGDRRVTLVQASRSGEALVERSELFGASLLAVAAAEFTLEEISTFTKLFQRLSAGVATRARDADGWTDEACRRLRAADGDLAASDAQFATGGTSDNH